MTCISNCLLYGGGALRAELDSMMEMMDMRYFPERKTGQHRTAKKIWYRGNWECIPRSKAEWDAGGLCYVHP